MFELRKYVGANPPVVTFHANGLAPLTELAAKAAREGGFDYTRAECWWKGVRQWELSVD